MRWFMTAIRATNLAAAENGIDFARIGRRIGCESRPVDAEIARRLRP